MLCFGWRPSFFSFQEPLEFCLILGLGLGLGLGCRLGLEIDDRCRMKQRYGLPLILILVLKTVQWIFHLRLPINRLV